MFYFCCKRSESRI